MSDAVKVAGICCSAVASISFALMGQMELCYSFAGVFGALLGLPIIAKGIQKLVKP
jgi:hypothetical protein